MVQAKGLGKGLSALLGENLTANPTQDNSAQSQTSGSIAIEKLSPWSKQPRQRFDEQELAELADSIAKNGIVQPIVVRKATTEGAYEIIAGERRWRAAQMAGLKVIPALIMDLSDEKALEVALIENIQRQDLTALEMANSYQRLIDEYSYTQEKLSEVLGKSRAQISNTLRLRELPENVKSLLNDNKISPGHARSLVGSPFASDVAERIVTEGLNVRQVEFLVKKLEKPLRANAPRVRLSAGSRRAQALVKTLDKACLLQPALFEPLLERAPLNDGRDVTDTISQMLSNLLGLEITLRSNSPKEGVTLTLDIDSPKTLREIVEQLKNLPRN